MAHTKKNSSFERKINFFALSFLIVFINLLFTQNIFAQIGIRGQTDSMKLTIPNLKLTKPAGLKFKFGDVMIANIATNNNNTNPVLLGWTLIKAGQLGSNKRYGSLLYKIVSANDTSSAAIDYTFNLGVGVNGAAGRIICFYGVDTTNLFDATLGNINSANSSVINAESIITTTPNTALVMFTQIAGSSTSTSFNNTWYTNNPGSLQELYDTSTSSTAVAAAWATKSSIGSTGLGIDTIPANRNWGAILIPLRRCKPTIFIQSQTTTSICENSSFTISASVSNATGYQWRKDGVNIPGATSFTYSKSNASVLDSGKYSLIAFGRCGINDTSSNLNVNVVTNTVSATINADYCLVPGKVHLTAIPSPVGVYSYLWSDSRITDTINVEIAGSYSVTVTNNFGCTANASIPVSIELARNGNFNLGNVGFVTPGVAPLKYSYVIDTPGIVTELNPEGKYGIGPNARRFHVNFWGKDHTTGTGNFMIVNGFPNSPQPIVWQDTIGVLPNTNYYFSAWAMSVNSAGNYAQLKFSVNGTQIGTTANLVAHPQDSTSADNWIRFYGTWNSGVQTKAICSIVDLQTATAGNDFGLDDISISSLAPYVAMTSSSTSDSQTVCVNTPIANITFQVGSGGSAPVVSNLPPGISSVYNGSNLIISGSPNKIGVYSFSIQTTGSCNAVTYNGQITVKGQSITLTSATGTNIQNICSPASITNIVYNIGGTATSASVTGLPSGITGVYNAVAKTFTISGTSSQIGTFNFTISSSGTECSIATASGTITVNQPATSATLSALTPSSCSSSRSAIKVDIVGGTPGYTIVINNGSYDTTITPVISGRNIYVTPSATTTYTLISVTDSKGCLGTGMGDTTKITIDQSPTSAVIATSSSALSNICVGDSGAFKVKITSGASPYTLVYTNGSSNFNITNYNSLSNVFVRPNASTTYSLVSVTSAYSCPILTSDIQGAATIFVSNMTQSGSITGGGNNVCTGTNLTTLNLNNAVGTIQWQSSIDSVNYTNISGAANTTLQVSNLTSKKYYRANVKSGYCPALTAVPTFINVNLASVAGNISQTQPVCKGSNVSIVLSNSLGSIQWQSSSDNINFNDLPGETNATLSINNILDTTYYRTKVKNGVCNVTTAQFVQQIVKMPGLWTSSEDNNWNNINNWSCTTLPDTSIDVSIPANTSNGDPYIGLSTAYVKSIKIGAGANLNIVEGQVLKIAGVINGIGKIDSRDGDIEFVGNKLLNISPKSFLNNTLKTLKVSTTQGINIDGINDTLKVSGSVKFGTSNTTLYTNGKLTLLSTASGTANIEDMTSDGINTGVFTGNRIIGDVTIERYIGTHPKTWQLLSAPAIGHTINETWQERNTVLGNNTQGYGTIITSNLPNATSLGFDAYTPNGASLKVYNSQTGAWDGVASTSQKIDNAKGYMIYVRGDRSVYQFAQSSTPTTLRTFGKLYTPIDNPVQDVFVESDKFETIGNPYASAIDFNKLNKSGGIQNAFYVWDPMLTNSSTSSYGLGAYQTFIGNGNGTYTVIPGGGSYSNLINNTGNGIIQSGLAFFVRASGTSGSISFTESAKANGSSLVTRASSEINIPRVALNLYAVANSNPTLLDGTIAEFDDEFSNEIDERDILKMPVSTENISILSGVKKLVAERRKNTIGLDTLNIELGQLKIRSYQLEINPQQFDQSATNAVLYDRFLSTQISVNLTHETLYSFDVNSTAGSYAANRFFIVFNNRGVLPVKFIAVNAKRTQHAINIHWSVANEINIEKYQIEKSLDGIHFSSTNEFVLPKANNGGIGYYDFSDKNNNSVNNLFYRIKSIDKNGSIQLSEVVKVVKLDDINNIYVYPNPVINKVINIYIDNLASDRYEIKLFDLQGKLIKSASIQYSNNHKMILSLDKKINSGIYSLNMFTKNGVLLHNIQVNIQ
jgi:hypothetical protein